MAQKSKKSRSARSNKGPRASRASRRSESPRSNPDLAINAASSVPAEARDAEAVPDTSTAASFGSKRRASSPHTPTKKARIESTSPPPASSPPHYPSPPHEQATDLDRTTWEGFCEIESDPSFFNVMLNEMGVRGVKLQEIYGLDPSTLVDIPKPIYGFILLFRYRPVDSDNEEPQCPDGIWFANQMPSTNSCATLAIINILMNTEDVDVGDNLQQFKEFTDSFSPYQRGQEIANFKFIKRIHNSFAKKMDMLQEDAKLKEEFEAEDPKKKSRRISIDSDSSSERNKNHFIAFVPVDGEVWKLDGMDAYPTKMGDYEGTSEWYSVASEKVSEIIAAGMEDDAGYSLLAIVKCPIETFRADLCANIAYVDLLETKLAEVDADWKNFAAEDTEPLTGPSEELGITPEMLSAVELSEEVQKKVEKDGDLTTLLEKRERAVKENLELQSGLREEVWRMEEDMRKAEERRFDYTPVITTWLRKLAEKELLESLLKE